MTTESIILFIGAILGGAVSFFFSNIKSTNFKLVLAFSGAFMLAITIVHLLPEVFSLVDVKGGVYDKGQMTLVLGMLVIGFLMQRVFDYFTHGVEHGHVHSEKQVKNLVPIVVLIALSLHSFLEGSVLEIGEHGHHHHHHHHHGDGTSGLMWAILIHKIPAAFVLGTILLFKSMSKVSVGIYLFIFAISAPMGQLLMHEIQEAGLLSEFSSLIIYALVAGNFLHIATTIFIESDAGHKFNLVKFAVTALGAGLAIFLELSM